MLNDVFYLEETGFDETTGTKIQERRNGHGARVYGANIDYKIVHGKERSCSWASPYSKAATPRR